MERSNEFGHGVATLRVAGMLACLGGVAYILFGGVKTASNFRVLSDLVQNLLVLAFVLLLFWPDARAARNALALGAFTMAYDFILETTAVYLDWWYPLGGTQFPPVLVVPLEMVSSFLLIGAATYFLLDAPARIREGCPAPASWFRPAFRDPRFDDAWRVAFTLLVAVVGTRGDYTAGPDIWAPGPQWHVALTFVVWFSGGLLVLLVYKLMNRSRVVNQ
ncbi:MAG: hypothetical protein ACTSU5_08665 [Promethearchaeota archaeon]